MDFRRRWSCSLSSCCSSSSRWDFFRAFSKRSISSSDSSTWRFKALTRRLSWEFPGFRVRFGIWELWENPGVPRPGPGLGILRILEGFLGILKEFLRIFWGFFIPNHSRNSLVGILVIFRIQAPWWECHWPWIFMEFLKIFGIFTSPNHFRIPCHGSDGIFGINPGS